MSKPVSTSSCSTPHVMHISVSVALVYSDATWYSVWIFFFISASSDAKLVLLGIGEGAFSHSHGFRRYSRKTEGGCKNTLHPPAVQWKLDPDFWRFHSTIIFAFLYDNTSDIHRAYKLVWNFLVFVFTFISFFVYSDNRNASWLIFFFWIIVSEMNNYSHIEKHHSASATPGSVTTRTICAIFFWTYQSHLSTNCSK